MNVYDAELGQTLFLTTRYFAKTLLCIIYWKETNLPVHEILLPFDTDLHIENIGERRFFLKIKRNDKTVQGHHKRI